MRSTSFETLWCWLYFPRGASTMPRSCCWLADPGIWSSSRFPLYDFHLCHKLSRAINCWSWRGSPWSGPGGGLRLDSPQVVQAGHQASATLESAQKGLLLERCLIVWNSNSQAWTFRLSILTPTKISSPLQCSVVPRQTCSLSHLPQKPQRQKVNC